MPFELMNGDITQIHVDATRQIPSYGKAGVCAGRFLQPQGRHSLKPNAEKSALAQLGMP